jgi:acyl-coenzyme A thioesterase 13
MNLEMEQKLFDLLKKNIGGPFVESKSAAGKWMQYTLQEVKEGEVCLRLTVLPDMCNPLQQLHGGIFALIMDEAVGLAFYTVCKGEFYTSANLHVHHLRSAALGEVLYATGQVIKHGKKIAYTEGTIRNANNEIICRATSDLIYTGKRIFDLYAS